MRRLIKNRLNQTGDTIVEVLIVLTVLGLALSISYATANHGLIQARNAEEHSEALGIIDSQIELVRQAFAQHTDTSHLTNGIDFCMSDPTNPAISTPLTHNVPAVASADLLTANYPPQCVNNSLYYVSVQYDTTDPSNPFYDFRVRWDGLGNLGRQQEEIAYLIHGGP